MTKKGEYFFRNLFPILAVTAVFLPASLLVKYVFGTWVLDTPPRFFYLLEIIMGAGLFGFLIVCLFTLLRERRFTRHVRDRLLFFGGVFSLVICVSCLAAYIGISVYEAANFPVTFSQQPFFALWAFAISIASIVKNRGRARVRSQ